MISILAYSDIHFHQYANGVTIQDVVEVENQVIQIAKERDPDFIVFCGDRYLSRNPTTETMLTAMKSLWHVANLGIEVIILVGNHDRATKSPYSEHSFGIVPLFRNEMPNVTVLDKLGSTTVRTKSGVKVEFHAVPAGHKLGGQELPVDGDADFRIALFHDIIRGSKYTNGMVAPEGVSPALLDREIYDLVLGGDNHQPQDLDFSNTLGLYIGAPLQHNWGDYGSERGCVYATLTDENVNVERIPLKYPVFVKEDVVVNSDDDIQNFIKNIGDKWRDNVVKCTFTGRADVFNGFQASKLHDKLKAKSGARSIKINLEHIVQVPLLTAIKKTGTPQDEWLDYVRSKSEEFTDINRTKLEAIGMEIILDADRS